MEYARIWDHPRSCGEYAIPDDLDFVFTPVRQPNDEELANLAKTGSDSVLQAFNAALISPRLALKELKQQSDRTGFFTNISDDDIEKASDEVEQQPEMGDMGSLNGEGGKTLQSKKKKRHRAIWELRKAKRREGKMIALLR